MLENLKKLLKQVNETPKIDLGSASNPILSNNSQNLIPQIASMSESVIIASKQNISPKIETKAERTSRINRETRLEDALKNKFINDIDSEKNTPENEFLKDSEPLLKGSKEYAIMLETIEQLKAFQIKNETQNEKNLNISVADKSRFIVMVYKELREQLIKNQELMKELSELKYTIEQKNQKIIENQQEIKKLRNLVNETGSMNKKYSEKLREFEQIRKNEEKTIKDLMNNLKEIKKMQSNDNKIFIKVFFIINYHNRKIKH